MANDEVPINEVEEREERGTKEKEGKRENEKKREEKREWRKEIGRV